MPIETLRGQERNQGPLFQTIAVLESSTAIGQQHAAQFVLGMLQACLITN